jgi:SAGA-associated factor 29
MGNDADTGRVSLRFDGEENNVTLQLVDRRFVVEYRS